MAEEDLFKWCQGRPVWQQAMVSMLTGAAELSDEEYDGFRVALKQEHKIIPGTPGAWPTLTKTQLKSDASTAPVTILGSIGPLKNIDRLAGDQPPLQFAVAGITLIYGANGSGKSGYCRSGFSAHSTASVRRASTLLHSRHRSSVSRPSRSLPWFSWPSLAAFH
jgi:hypothetical protein